MFICYLFCAFVQVEVITWMIEIWVTVSSVRCFPSIQCLYWYTQSDLTLPFWKFLYFSTRLVALYTSLTWDSIIQFLVKAKKFGKRFFVCSIKSFNAIEIGLDECTSDSNWMKWNESKFNIHSISWYKLRF